MLTERFGPCFPNICTNVEPLPGTQQIPLESVVTSAVVVAVGFPLFCSNKHGEELGLL